MTPDYARTSMVAGAAETARSTPFAPSGVRTGGRFQALPALGLVSVLAGCDGDPVAAPPPNGGLPGDSLRFELVWEHESPLQTFTLLQDRNGRPYFYVTQRSGGLLVFDASEPDAPQLVHTLPGAEFGGQFTNNLHQVGQHLYVATGNFMGLPQQPPGLAIVDVSEPGSAFVSGTWTHDSGTRGAHVVEVHGDHAFLGASFEGLIVLDVSDPEGIGFVSQYVPDINFPGANPPPLQMPAARGLTLADPQTLLLAYDAGGLRVIDIGNLAAPVEVGRHINTAIDPSVQAQAYNNVVVRGMTAFIAVDYCGVEIVNIADRETPLPLAWWDPWECAGDPLNWFTSPGHTNELVLLPGEDRLFISAGDIQLVVLDVEDPSGPRLLQIHGEEGNHRVAWGLDVTPSHVLLAQIRSPGGPFSSHWAGVSVLRYE